jgi:hypothetical protein
MNKQLVSFVQNSAPTMRADALYAFAEDAISRVKSNQESNPYIQDQIQIIEILVKELKIRTLKTDNKNS